ncbi:MAG: protein-disulfide reductase DsbD family protein [Rubricoccaceae bacterium]|nr:protein-disulfide reductase DsbD family protein [Rubricoccaceae bacterium]
MHRALPLLLLLAPALVAAQDDPSPHSDADLVSDAPAVRPGEAFEVALRLTMDPGWHSYWQNPGDSGLPTRIDWALPPGFEAGPIQWPYPERIEVLPFVSYGYSDEVLLPVRITPPASLDAPEVTLAGTASWLICEDVCLPAEGDVALTLPVGDGGAVAPEETAAMAAARDRLPLASAAWTARAEPADGGYALHVTPPAGWSGSLEDAYFFAETEAVVQHAAPQPTKRQDEGFLIFLPASEYATGPAERLTGVLVAPEGSDIAAGRRALALDVPVVGAETAAAAAPSRAGIGLGLTLLLAFLGGLLLNLMPCVFPVLSIKILGFAQGRSDEPATIRRHGLVFGLGVLASFAVLAGLLLGFRAAGEEIGWGFQLQNPWIVAGLALLLFGIGLNLAGVFEFGLRLASAGGRLDRGDGLGGAFFSGVLATVVATPCVAPFMGAALGAALTQPAPLAVLVFLTLGLGMALPYVLLSLFPGWLQRLPRPGPWMETLKQVLAFPMFLTAVWLVWVFGQQTGLNGVALLLVAFTAVALAAWLVGRWDAHGSTRRQRVVSRTAAALALAGAMLAVGAGVGQQAAAAPTAGSGDWAPFDPAAVERLVADGRPVFVDFTAAWCLSCQANKAVALSTDAVDAAFERKGVARFRADWTNRDPVITAALERFGRSGVPLYVLYPGGGGAPRILPEILTPGLVLDALDTVDGPVAVEGADALPS